VCCFDAEGRFTLVNAFALNTWKIEEHEALGQTLQAVVPSKATEEILNVFWQALRTQERMELETIGLRHNGWIGIVMHPDHGGLVMHVRRLLENTPTARSGVAPLLRSSG
jgi:PAS domain-containing protein